MTHMDIRQEKSHMSETVLKKHLEKALDESDPAEKNYHIRSALQHIASEETNQC